MLNLHDLLINTYLVASLGFGMIQRFVSLLDIKPSNEFAFWPRVETPNTDSHLNFLIFRQ